MIIAEKIQGNWNQLRGAIKQRWGQLTDDDLREFDGNLDSLVGFLQEKTGETRESIEHYLEELSAKGASMFGKAAETAKHYVSSAASAVGSTPHVVAEEARAGYTAARRTVRQRPTESVAVAFAAGLVAGAAIALLFRSR